MEVCQGPHQTHSNLGLITIDESQGDDCICPSLTWTVLDVLVLIALVIFAISLARRCGALTLAHFRQRAQQTKRVRMEKLKAEILEEERRVDRENHIHLVRMIAPSSENA